MYSSICVPLMYVQIALYGHGHVYTAVKYKQRKKKKIERRQPSFSMATRLLLPLSSVVGGVGNFHHAAVAIQSVTIGVTRLPRTC